MLNHTCAGVARSSLRRRVVTAGLSCVLALSCTGVLTGCGQAATSTSTDTAQSQSASSQSSDQSAEQATETRTVTVNGTDYTIPAQVQKVAPTIGALAQITMMLSPNDGVVSAAATSQISDQFKQVLPAYGQGNPNNYDSSDVEQIIQSGAQVAYGPSSAFSDEQKQQLTDAGVTFIAMDSLSTVDDICNTTEAIGQILGGDAETRAEDFVAFWKANTSGAQSRTANLSDDQKPTVLSLAYSNGAFTTESGQSLITSYIEAAGGVSLARDYTSSSQQSGGKGGKGGATVNEEQIVAWDPDYIITYSTDATNAIMSDAALADVTAVKEGHVYTSPKGLYLWSVRSGEGAMMAPWIGTKINPDLFSDVDMNQMVKDFFKNYYNYDLSDSDAEAILNGTY